MIATWALAVSFAIFVLGVVFGAGKLTARIEALEVWRTEILRRFDTLDSKMDRAIELIREHKR